MANDTGAKKDLDRKQIITIVALFAVLLLVVYFFLLKGDGDEPVDLGPVPVAGATETPGAIDPEPAPEPEETPDPNATDEPDEGPKDPPTNTLRDPFQPPPGAGVTTGNPFEEPAIPSTEESPTPDPTPTPEATPSP